MALECVPESEASTEAWTAARGPVSSRELREQKDRREKMGGGMEGRTEKEYGMK